MSLIPRLPVGFHADVLLVLAKVLHLARRPEEAVPLIREAIGLLDLKGNVVTAAKARTALEGLR